MDPGLEKFPVVTLRLKIRATSQKVCRPLSLRSDAVSFHVCPYPLESLRIVQAKNTQQNAVNMQNCFIECIYPYCLEK